MFSLRAFVIFMVVVGVLIFIPKIGVELTKSSTVKAGSTPKDRLPIGVAVQGCPPEGTANIRSLDEVKTVLDACIKEGDADSHYRLGQFYADNGAFGDVMMVNFLFGRAASLGHTEAAFGMADLYLGKFESRYGGEPEWQEVHFWLQIARTRAPKRADEILKSLPPADSALLQNASVASAGFVEQYWEE